MAEKAAGSGEERQRLVYSSSLSSASAAAA
jgi:hypothetical protein